ncbi:MAG: phytoene/squalene synthase family protein [Saprospiraceae bacterium]|nr:phytoene/squalene synthase family protein [Saprospiraceae bacterium]
MKALYDQVSTEIGKCITRHYSTSFSFGIYMLHKSLHNPIYSIYGFVRVADEIVDSFHDYEKELLLERFTKDTFDAIDMGISINPVLNAFQSVVHKYGIKKELIVTFLQSMKMDLNKNEYNQQEFERYVLGSAEVVGLMCLQVFVNGDQIAYKKLKPSAMKLGAAFQKVNFLRDLKADFTHLGRSYFPQVNLNRLCQNDKVAIEKSIQEDFDAALDGIRKLPRTARLGVYTAYVYYYQLFRKIKLTPPALIMKQRIRISNPRKIFLLLKSYVTLSLKMV